MRGMGLVEMGLVCDGRKAGGWEMRVKDLEGESDLEVIGRGAVLVG